MTFQTESTGYEKTILSDLQGAWIVLRESVANSARFEGSDRVLFHIDKAMSWEAVRNLRLMPPTLLKMLFWGFCVPAHKWRRLSQKAAATYTKCVIWGIPSGKP